MNWLEIFCPAHGLPALAGVAVCIKPFWTWVKSKLPIK